MSDQQHKYFWRWLAISKEMNVNEKIRAREIRLIDSNGDQLGVKSRKDALEIAETRNLDLVLVAPSAKRSEEHTSELQSRFDLVCRLLLEKKKVVNYIYTIVNIKY